MSVEDARIKNLIYLHRDIFLMVPVLIITVRWQHLAGAGAKIRGKGELESTINFCSATCTERVIVCGFFTNFSFLYWFKYTICVAFFITNCKTGPGIIWMSYTSTSMCQIEQFPMRPTCPKYSISNLLMVGYDTCIQNVCICVVVNMLSHMKFFTIETIDHCDL